MSPLARRRLLASAGVGAAGIGLGAGGYLVGHDSAEAEASEAAGVPFFGEHQAGIATAAFSLTLEKGRYTLQCNGGSNEDGTLTVTGESTAAKSDPEAEAAVNRYRKYLVANTDGLVEKTEPFVAAVIVGDVARAKSLYPAGRIPYERVEPVAESFGDLDPEIDARANDVPPSRFGGFHRIEKALWLPMLEKNDPALAKKIEAQFTAVERSLDPYRRGDGFVSYTELTPADTRKLAQTIDALAESLSEVPAQIVG